jgi:hypothetical protein
MYAYTETVLVASHENTKNHRPAEPDGGDEVGGFVGLIRR